MRYCPKLFYYNKNRVIRKETQKKKTAEISAAFL